MMSVHSEVGTNQSSQVVNTLLACDSSRSKFLVQQSTAGFTVVHLGAGFNNCGRSVDISTLLRRDTLRQRIMSQTAVRSSDHNITEVYVAGGRKHIYMIYTASGGRSAGNIIFVFIEYTYHDVICIIIIVAVFRSFILNQVQNVLMALEIVVHSVDEFFHGKLLIVKYVELDSGECIGNSADTNTLDVACVVSRAACVVVFTFLDTVIGTDGKERSRHHLRVDSLDNQVAAHLNIDDVLKLCLECVPQFVIGFEVFCFAGVRSDLFFEHYIVAIIQSEL